MDSGAIRSEDLVGNQNIPIKMKTEQIQTSKPRESSSAHSRVVFLVGSVGESSASACGSLENPTETIMKNEHAKGSDDDQKVFPIEFLQESEAEISETKDVYQQLIPDDDSTIMSSSVICTDGSDVEVLSEEDETNGNGKESSLMDMKHSSSLNVPEDMKNSLPSTEDSSPETESITRTEELLELETGLGTDQEELLGAAAHIEAVVQIYNQNEKKTGIAQEVDATLWEGNSGETLHGTKRKSKRHSKYCVSRSSSGGLYSDDGLGYNELIDIDMQVENGSIHRPDSLSLPRPLQYYERRRLARQESGSSTQSDMYSHHSSTEALIEAVTSTPLHVQGTIIKDGDMMSFVTEDLTEKIRISSPPIRINDSGSNSWTGSRTPSGRSVSSVASTTSGWSTSSASGWSAFSNSGMSRSKYGVLSPSVVTQSPEDIPPIDPHAVRELENHAHRVAESLTSMMINLRTSLHKMSSVTESCLATYKDSIDHTCDSVDASIKSMYALMAKCEELSTRMKPVYELAEQIKEIKRLLDLFEAQMEK